MEEGCQCNITRVAPCSCIFKFDGAVGIPGGGFILTPELDTFGEDSREDGWLLGLLFLDELPGLLFWEALGCVVEYFVLTDVGDWCDWEVNCSVTVETDAVVEVGDMFIFLIPLDSFLVSSKSRLTRTGSSPVQN